MITMKTMRGFTLIETLVVVAIIITISAVTMLGLSRYRLGQDLNRTADEIMATLRAAQNSSITQQDGKQWGVRFVASTSTGYYYDLWSGASYSTSSVVKRVLLRATVKFVDPVDGTFKDIVFLPVTGDASAYFSVTIASRGDPTVFKAISVDTSGVTSVAQGQGLLITAINPNSWNNNSSVSISSVSGREFQSGSPGTTVKLTKSGQADISLVGYSISNSNTITGGSFNLTNATTGPWNVVVADPDSSSFTLPNGFTVTLPAPVVASISPNSAMTNSTVNNVSVGGNYFQNSATVNLTKGGQSDINGSGFTFSSPTTLSNGSFNLSGAAPGSWSVVVTNPDSQSGTLFNGFTVNSVATTGTIDSTWRYAWNDNIGWLDFATSGSNVVVSSSSLTGYTWNEGIGWVSLNCSNGGSCDTISYKVTNTVTGTLAGYAWSDNIGWISFKCPNSGSCGTINYGVTIDSSGDFHGWAWNDNIGWISFNCFEPDTCVPVNYRVNTTWRPQ